MTDQNVTIFHTETGLCNLWGRLSSNVGMTNSIEVKQNKLVLSGWERLISNWSKSFAIFYFIFDDHGEEYFRIILRSSEIDKLKNEAAFPAKQRKSLSTQLGGIYLSAKSLVQKCKLQSSWDKGGPTRQIVIFVFVCVCYSRCTALSFSCLIWVIIYFALRGSQLHF